MNRIVELSARHVQMPLKEPFETAKRRAEVSDTVAVQVATDGGLVGMGAATPVHYVTGETVESVISAVDEATAVVVGRAAAEYAAISRQLAEVLPAARSARAGIEIALIDAAGKARGVPSYALFGGAPMSVETDVTIPIMPPVHAGELAAAAAAQGFRLFKVKVGSRSADEDLARAAAIAQAAPASSLVIDANQGFDADGAMAFLRKLRRAGVNVAVLEQPVDRLDLEGLARVTQGADVPVFADESALCPADVLRLVESHAVAGVNVKLMKTGFLGGLEIAAICRASGLGLMLGCMLEPRVGIAAALHLACAAGCFHHFDLDADLLLAEQRSGGFTREGPWIHPLTAPGLGCLSAS